MTRERSIMLLCAAVALLACGRTEWERHALHVVHHDDQRLRNIVGLRRGHPKTHLEARRLRRTSHTPPRSDEAIPLLHVLLKYFVQTFAFESPYGRRSRVRRMNQLLHDSTEFSVDVFD